MQVIHQAFVQLELIEPQTRQGHEIGIGHTKIVDGHPEAFGPDAVHDLLERTVILRTGRFRDLHL